VTFNAFKSIVQGGGVVRAIPAPGAVSRPRSFFDKLNEWARADMGAAGLGYLLFEEDAGAVVARGPIAKFIPEAAQRALADRAGVGAGDALFFSAGKADLAVALAGAARTRLGEELGLVEQNVFRFCWITDFPMYEWNEQEKRIDFSHNPFSMPQGGLDALNNKDPLDILGFQNDIVCNGIELSSGAIRNHEPEIMIRAFEIAGYAREEVESRFGGMLNAFRYGAPPHGGIAPGVDRIVMLLADAPNIREVIPFPLNQQAQDLLMNAPSAVDERQLRELHIRIVQPAAAKPRD
jgi:aspartyl-tRNA synthetase